MGGADFMEIDEQIHSLIVQEKLPEALKLANEYVKEQPNSAEAYFLLSYAKSSWNQTAEAVDDLKRAITIDPMCAKYYSLLGAMYVELGDDEAAINEYKRALHIEPDNLKYKTNLSKAKAYSGKVDEALADVESLYRSHSDSDFVKNNLTEIYIKAVTKDWYYHKEDDSYFALSHDHVRTAEEYITKAKALSSENNKDQLSHITDLEEAINIAKKRKFTGGWGTLIMAFLFSSTMFSVGGTLGYLFSISALLYYYALRTPQYVTNHQIFSNKDNLTVGDRIASMFSTDGWTFYGPGYFGAITHMVKTNMVMAFVRGAIRLLLLPITVLAALFSNYPKAQAYLFIGVMVAFVAAFNTSDWIAKEARESSLISMIEAVKVSDFETLASETQSHPGIFRKNKAKLFEEAIRSDNVKSLNYLLTKSSASVRGHYKNFLIDTAIKSDKKEVIAYLSENLFKKDKAQIITALNKNGPFSGKIGSRRAGGIIPVNVDIKVGTDNAIEGRVEFTQSKSIVSIKGKILGNVVKLSETAVENGEFQGDNCEYILKMAGSSVLKGWRVCAGEANKQVRINLK